MATATNLLIIILCINLAFFVFGKPENASPVLGMVSAFLTGVDPITVIIQYGNALAIYLLLIGVIAAASVATGANYLTTGGGYGAAVALKILAISIFSALALFPNFTSLGFPSLAGSGIPILEIIQIIFGGLLTITVVEILGS